MSKEARAKVTESLLKILYIFYTASLVLIFDRATKSIVIANLYQDQSIKILPNLFHITLVLNKGLAFGLLKGERLSFIPPSILIILCIIFYIWRKALTKVYQSIALGLVLGGAIGNLIDRIRYGYVIDFLDFRIWPVFNIADSSITIGAMILVWSILRKKAKIKFKSQNSKVKTTTQNLKPKKF